MPSNEREDLVGLADDLDMVVLALESVNDGLQGFQWEHVDGGWVEVDRIRRALRRLGEQLAITEQLPPTVAEMWLQIVERRLDEDDEHINAASLGD